jgi:hypothetical protein
METTVKAIKKIRARRTIKNPGKTISPFSVPSLSSLDGREFHFHSCNPKCKKTGTPSASFFAESDNPGQKSLEASVVRFLHYNKGKPKIKKAKECWL